jgi:hypothetical protein
LRISRIRPAVKQSQKHACQAREKAGNRKKDELKVFGVNTQEDQPFFILTETLGYITKRGKKINRMIK